MPVLPVIDLLILLGSGFLAIGFVLKSIAITTTYQAAILGFSSIDFVVMAGVCLGFALTLAARTWVKLHEARLLQQPRSYVSPKGRRFQTELQAPEDDDYDGPPVADVAAGRRR